MALEVMDRSSMRSVDLRIASALARIDYSVQYAERTDELIVSTR
jgi:hypothetical protein